MARTSYDAVNDFSRGAFAIGSARRRSRTQGMSHVPGPSGPVAGAITPEGALAKVAHALVAGQVNRTIDDANYRATVLENARTLEKDRLAAENTQSLLDQRKLEAQPGYAEQRAYEQGRGGERARAEHLDETMVDVDTQAPDLAPFVGAGKKLRLADVTNYRSLHGLDQYGNKPKQDEYIQIPGVKERVKVGSDLYNAYRKRQLGLRSEGEGGGKFDPYTEAEREGLSRAEGNLRDVTKRLTSEAFSAPGASLSSLQAYTDANTLPPEILGNDEYKTALAGVTATQGRNALGTLNRANDLASITQANRMFYVGDPLKHDPAVGKIRKAKILRAIQLAQKRADLSALWSATEDAKDPLNSDPDVMSALHAREAALPE